jgi:hypothetical protein
MAKRRQAKWIKEGEYNGSATWYTGRGIEERERAAEDIGIKVIKKWVYLYLCDGEEIIKLMRSTNTSAQIYPDMTLREVMQERALNRLGNSTTCCYGYYNLNSKCGVHTAEWLEVEIEDRLAEVISDEDWPSVLAKRKIEAQKAQECLEQKALERQLAQDSGEGEWRKSDGEWKVWTLRQPKVGSTAVVRTRSGDTKKVVIDSSYEAPTGWLSESHPAPVVLMQLVA